MSKIKLSIKDMEIIKRTKKIVKMNNMKIEIKILLEGFESTYQPGKKEAMNQKISQLKLSRLIRRK